MYWILIAFTPLVVSNGISRHRDNFSDRYKDSPILDAVPCVIPTFADRLSPPVRAKILNIWKDYRDSDCWIEMARTSFRNLLQQLSSEERSRISNHYKECKAPDIVEALPLRAQKRVMQIWKERDPKGNCSRQQRRTKLLLLNLPASLQYMLHPPAFDCAPPHFIDRLEWDLQVQLRRIWDGYRYGTPCQDRVEKQLNFLSENDISLQSFQMPPPTLFRRYDIIRKLKHTNLA